MGGQGLVLAGIIMAEAAIAQGYNVVQTASYGPESRGGASRSEVIVSEFDIDYPAVINADYLLAMTQEAAERFAGEIKPGGIALYDTTWVKTPPRPDGVRLLGYQLTEAAIERYQKAIFANIIGLGIICASADVIDAKNMLGALLARVPKRHKEANEQAFGYGMELFRTGKLKVSA
jgi:2-oxoglutarate ferredoxin oxidoreductase subunit gamma